MSYYHHGGEFQPDHTLPTEQTDFIPGWETIDQPQQHQAPQESPSSSTFVSPAVSTPHALPPQQFEYSPLTPTLDYGEMPDVPFPNPAGTTITFAPHERLVRSEGYPSPETEAFQHSPSPTTPSASGPQRTHTRATGSQGSGSGSKPHHLHRPYTRRSQSALAGKTKEATGARFSVVGAGSGIQAYPASMSMPTQEMGTSHASPSTMLPPSITRPQRPSLIPTSTSSHQPMGPPLEPPRSAIALPPEPTDLRSAQATQVPSPATGSGVASFEAIIQKVRSVKKHFFTPRLDTFYDTDSHVLRAYIELPGVRRNNLRVTLATSAITRHRNVSVWGISLSPAWLPTGSAQAGTSQTVGAVGTTIQSGLRYPGCPRRWSSFIIYLLRHTLNSRTSQFHHRKHHCGLERSQISFLISTAADHVSSSETLGLQTFVETPFTRTELPLPLHSFSLSSTQIKKLTNIYYPPACLLSCRLRR
ncbi:hypothetical protein EV361DRAFT_876516 [Lentinula raphanica]|nr:hypothetical protein EV361DRAFT_876516 [Lentinula raphanica]